MANLGAIDKHSDSFFPISGRFSLRMDLFSRLTAIPKDTASDS